MRPALIGLATVIVAESALAVAALLVKTVTTEGVPSTVAAFARFALGAAVLWAWMLAGRRSPKPVAWRPVLARALGNSAAVLLFYEAIRLTTLTKANVLNMTYPIFIAAAGPLLLGEPTTRTRLAAVVLGTLGIVLVVDPGPVGLAWGDAVGLACGIVSAGAIMALRAARRRDRVDTILLWVMTTGTLVTLPFADGLTALPPGTAGPLLAAAILGVGGQFGITAAYRWVSAVDGSVASTIRIFMAGALGVSLLGEPLGASLIVGATAILGAITMVARRAGQDAS